MRQIKVKWKGHYINTMNQQTWCDGIEGIITEEQWSRICSYGSSVSAEFLKSKIFDFKEPDDPPTPLFVEYVDDEKPQKQKKEKKEKNESSSSLPWPLRILWWFIKLPFKIVWWMFK